MLRLTYVTHLFVIVPAAAMKPFFHLFRENELIGEDEYLGGMPPRLDRTKDDPHGTPL